MLLEALGSYINLLASHLSEVLRHYRSKNRRGKTRCGVPGMYDTQQHASAVRKAHVFDVQKLEEFMSKHVSGFVPPLKVSQFNHGQSNPTFLLTDAKSTRYVLRKKPPGRLLNKAHAVQ